MNNFNNLGNYSIAGARSAIDTQMNDGEEGNEIVTLRQQVQDLTRRLVRVETTLATQAAPVPMRDNIMAVSNLKFIVLNLLIDSAILNYVETGP